MNLDDNKEIPLEEQALADLMREPARPATAFKAALYETLRLELRKNQSDAIPAEFDEGSLSSTMLSAPCPFTDFCWAKLPIPRALKFNCPCLKFGKVLQEIAARTRLLSLPRRPCPGLHAAEAREQP